VDFSRPIRRLTEGEALAMAREPSPTPPVLKPAPDTPTGWLARLVAFFSTLIRRA
jgi:lysozyme